LAAIIQFFIDFYQGPRGPYGKGVVGHCTSSHSLNSPLLSVSFVSVGRIYNSMSVDVARCGVFVTVGCPSVRPFVRPSVDSSRLSSHICRRRQSAAASGQRQYCDLRRIDADLQISFKLCSMCKKERPVYALIEVG